MASWKIRFYGTSDKFEPEVFLAKLDDCRISGDIRDSAVLRALPSVLVVNAATWWRSVRRDAGSWRDFKKAFRHLFVGELNGEDVMEELRTRTQAKGKNSSEILPTSGV